MPFLSLLPVIGRLLSVCYVNIILAFLDDIFLFIVTPYRLPISDCQNHHLEPQLPRIRNE